MEWNVDLHMIKEFAKFQSYVNTDFYNLIIMPVEDGKTSGYVLNPWKYEGKELSDDEAETIYGRKAMDEFKNKAAEYLSTHRLIRWEKNRLSRNAIFDTIAIFENIDVQKEKRFKIYADSDQMFIGYTETLEEAEALVEKLKRENPFEKKKSVF